MFAPIKTNGMKPFFCSIILLVLVGCRNNTANEPVVTGDTTVVVNEGPGFDSVVVFNNLDSWIDSTTASPPGLHLGLPNNWVEDSLVTSRFNPPRQFYKVYAPVLKWSADSSAILDIGSYGMVPATDKDGNVTLQGGEPDTEIAVVYPGKQLRKRLLYGGPGFVVLKAKWVDSSQVAVLASHPAANGLPDTTLYLIKPFDQLFRSYSVSH